MNESDKSPDEETTTQPLVDESEFDILKKEVEILRKENVKLKLENQRLVNEQERNKYETKDYSNEPTNDEITVLKLAQPPGGYVEASTIADLMKINLTVAQHHLNELVEKGFLYHNSTQAVVGFRPASHTYTLTDAGIKFLVNHNLTE